MAGHVACERRGTFCTVESERSEGCLSGRGAVEESLSAKFGGITNGSFANVGSRPRARRTRPKRGGRGVTRPAWLSRALFRPLQKASTNPYFYTTSFPPFFSLSAVGAQEPC